MHHRLILFIIRSIDLLICNHWSTHVSKSDTLILGHFTEMCLHLFPSFPLFLLPQVTNCKKNNANYLIQAII